KLTQVKAAAARTNGAVRIEAHTGTLSTDVIGGEKVWNQKYRCSLGFNVKDDNDYYFLTAGHCITGTENWYADSSRTDLMGAAIHKSWPGDDYGIVRYEEGKHGYGHVKVDGSWRDITARGYAWVGQDVTRTGSTTGTHSGTVLAVDGTANYPEGPVYDLIVTDICSASGDSGGAVFADNFALGIHSGGQGGGCPNDNARGYHQPVVEALDAYDAWVY
ncbi:S1 family peptidase, partial [Salinispora sp. H7-4]|uniref:S1 family peptidase n=1 Tax=Salinispora sp. H7-4 TaxID=2748321 RepID=UPI0015D263C5